MTKWIHICHQTSDLARVKRFDKFKKEHGGVPPADTAAPSERVVRADSFLGQQKHGKRTQHMPLKDGTKQGRRSAWQDGGDCMN